MTHIPKSRKRPWLQEKKKKFGSKSEGSKKFYNSRRWRKVRKQHLALNPYCVQCHQNKIVSIADVVDHIIPIENGGARYDDRNLQGLCDYHHNVKRGKERHDYVQAFTYNENNEKIPI